jgi:hypothetical protein
MIESLDIAEESHRNVVCPFGEGLLLQALLLAQVDDLGSIGPLPSKSDHITHALASDQSDPTIHFATGTVPADRRHIVGSQSGLAGRSSAYRRLMIDADRQSIGKADRHLAA